MTSPGGSFGSSDRPVIGAPYEQKRRRAICRSRGQVRHDLTWNNKPRAGDLAGFRPPRAARVRGAVGPLGAVR